MLRLMRTRVVVLGAGFGGLELTAILSDTFGDEIDIVLVDRSDAFVFGFSKLDVLFGRRMPADVHHRYSDIVKPGVRFLQSTVRSINPAVRCVVTDDGTFEADVLVVALGADLDFSATPGLVEGGNEFYSITGAPRTARCAPSVREGRGYHWCDRKVVQVPARPKRGGPAAARLPHGSRAT